jgi:hypothetical protein
MRFLGLALAGVLALMAPIAAHSASPGSNMGQAMTGSTPGVVQGSNWHPAPSERTPGVPTKKTLRLRCGSNTGQVSG